MIGRVEESSWPLGVVSVPCDGRQPPLQRGFLDLLRVDPSGVLRAQVHPHGVITILERLDPSTEEHLQQIQTYHPTPD